MSVNYYVALRFVRTEEGIAAGQGQECLNETAAIRRAESMSRDATNAGALAFKRTGDPNMGRFADELKPVAGQHWNTRIHRRARHHPHRISINQLNREARRSTR